ncbi:unnamed protein product [Sphacelaria rigidula]
MMVRTGGTVTSATNGSKVARTCVPDTGVDMTAGRKLCLDALTIALNEASSWGESFLPTKQLQLASLQLCIACRCVSTLCVKFDECTPRRLWTDPGEQSSTPTARRMDRSHKSRVPLLRAHSVVCMSSAGADIMSRETNVQNNVRNLYFDSMFDGSLDNAVWPPRVMEVVFGGRGSRKRIKFNQSITGVVWPASLQ